MRHLARLVLTLGLIGTGLIPGLAWADDTAAVRSVDLRDYPLVRLTLSTEERSSLSLDDVTVEENGVPVRVVSVDPLGGTGRRVDAVLVIDTSNSMEGPELETALAAARTFVQGVPPWLPVGVVSFAADSVVVSPITDDRASVELAVASIDATTSQGTALFNSVVQASGMFSGPGQHNLILLTDGRCRANPSGQGPCTLDGGLDDALEAAEAAGVTVFTIGLSETETSVPTLARIANATGGAHSIISLAELEGVYSGLAQELAQQFVITYRSKAPLGVSVSVTVGLPEGTARTSFLTPGLSSEVGGIESGGVVGDSAPVVTSDAAIAVLAGLVFLAALNLILLVLSAIHRRRRDVALRSRLMDGAFPSAAPEEALSASNPSLVPQGLSDAAERAAGSGVTGKLGRRLHQAGWSLRVGEFLTMVVFAGAAGLVAGFLLLGPAGALFALPAVLAPYALLSAAASKRLGAIQGQLADSLMVVASSLRAGHSFLQSLDTVTKEIGEPGASEFGRTMSEIRFGRSVDDALDALAERVGSQDLEWAVTAIKIQRKIGGNLAEILEGVATTIRERETLRRQVRVLSAEGRISAVVLTVLPILVAAYLARVNPEYLRTLTGTRLGVILISMAGGLMIVGYLWMQKIVKLDDV